MWNGSAFATQTCRDGNGVAGGGRRSAFVLALAAALGATACGPADDPVGPGGGDRPSLMPQSAALQAAFADCTAFKDYYTESLIAEYTADPYDGQGAGRVVGFAEDGAADASLAEDGIGGGDASRPANPDDVSRTNVQEEGVDEADVVKAATDGTLYVLSGTHFVVVDGFPPDSLTVAAELELGFRGDELYLDEVNDRAVVFGRVSGSFGGSGFGGAEPGLAEPAPDDAGLTLDTPFPGTVIAFVDLAPETGPVVGRYLFVEGWLEDSRRIGERVHAVSWYPAPLPETLTRDDELRDRIDTLHEAYAHSPGAKGVVERLFSGDSVRAEDRAALRSAVAVRVRALMAEVDAAALLPRVVERTAGGEAVERGPGCSDVYHPTVHQQPGIALVTSFATDGTGAASAGILNSAGMVYGSAENLYLVQTSNGWWWTSDQASQTAVHQFAIGGTTPAYRASGVVDGWVNDRFSLSEHDGHLRVATTSGEGNHLFVLRPTEAAGMVTTGAVRDLAPGERIMSARFLGDRGFLVTFRQVDPLFAFDLSDPEDPRLLGELKIPGFSSYIHPLGEEHLITVGVDGDESGATGGLALQIFDVADLANPELTHRYVPDAGGAYTWSAANYDPHAFTYYAPRDLLAIPLVSYDPGTGEDFAGIAAFRVTVTGGFTELGRVDHADLAWERYCGAGAEGAESGYDLCEGDYVWGGAPRRSVFMTSGADTFLYSLSRMGIKATPVEEPDTVLGTALLPEEPYGYWWWY